MPWIVSYSRALTGVILLVAGMSKLASPGTFAAVVDNYQLLPRCVSRLVARLLPIAEIVVAGLLLTRTGADFGALAAAGLFAVFAGAMSVNLLRGRSNIACGCFGSSESSPLRWRYAIRNIALAGTALSSAPAWWFAGAVQDLRTTDELAAMLAAGVTVACYWLVATSAGMLRRASAEMDAATEMDVAT